MLKEMNNEQNVAVRTQRPSIRVIDLSPLRPNLDYTPIVTSVSTPSHRKERGKEERTEKHQRPQPRIHHRVRQQQPRILQREPVLEPNVARHARRDGRRRRHGQLDDRYSGAGEHLDVEVGFYVREEQSVERREREEGGEGAYPTRSTALTARRAPTLLVPAHPLPRNSTGPYLHRREGVSHELVGLLGRSQNAPEFFNANPFAMLL